MSVPAFKNSRSKVRRRRSHHALKPVALVRDKQTGALVPPHMAVVSEGTPDVPEKKKEIKKKAPAAAAKKAKAEEKTEETAG